MVGGVAHEMTLRGYLVSFTMDNAPRTDLICTSPEGHPFEVQVKSLKAKGWFIFQKALLQSKPNLYVVFAIVPSDANIPPTYFVLNNRQFQKVAEEQAEIDRQREIERGVLYKKFSPVFSYKALDTDQFRNNWGNLPK